MTPHRYVVLARRARGFDTLDAAKEYALANYPAVIMERRQQPDGSSRLIEIARHDFLYDEKSQEWRIFLG